MPFAQIDEGVSLYHELTGPEDRPIVLQFGGGLFGRHNFGLVNDGFREQGFRLLKFFPADTAGSVGWLKAAAAPLADLKFCPTGGITAETAPGYLALPNVACVGGSWVAPKDAVAAGDWSRVERLAAAAAGLKRR